MGKKRTSREWVRPEEAVRQDLGSWCHRWFVAAFMQAQRAFAEWEADPQDPGSSELELMLFVDALNNVRRSAVAALGPTSEPISAFDSEVPGLSAIRNQIEHHDEYVRGIGNYQEGATHPIWSLGLEGGTVHVQGDLPRAHMRLRIDSWEVVFTKIDLHPLPSDPPLEGIRMQTSMLTANSFHVDRRDIKGNGEVDVVSALQAGARLVRCVLTEEQIQLSTHLKEADAWAAQHLAVPPALRRMDQ